MKTKQVNDSIQSLHHNIRIILQWMIALIIGLATRNMLAQSSETNQQTIADAGEDKYISVCDFPFSIQGNSPNATETVSWEIIEGNGYIMNKRSPQVSILDAADRLLLRYTIKNASGQDSTSDLVQLFVDASSLACAVNILVPDEIFCGDTVSVSLGNSSSTDHYYTNWISSTSLRLLEHSNTEGKLIITNANPTHDLRIIKYSPMYLHQWESTIQIQSRCASNISPAYAGSDDTLFCNARFISGNLPATGETGYWKLISGNATLDIDKHTPRYAFVLSKETTTIVLSWNISNGVTTTSDTIVLVSAPLRLESVETIAANCGEADGKVTINTSGGTPKLLTLINNIFIDSLAQLTLSPGVHSFLVLEYNGCNFVSGTFEIEENCTSTDPELTTETDAGVTSTAVLNTFPNPFTDVLNISLPSDLSGEIRISILNYTTGQALLDEHMTVQDEIKLNTAGLQEGMYILKLESENTSKTMLIEKVR